MKKLIFLGFFLATIGSGVYLSISEVEKSSSAPRQPSISATPSATAAPAVTTQESTAIFVPYWADMKSLDVAYYDRVIYFGIVPTIQGISKSEAGYKNISQFTKQLPEKKEALLAIRMTDTNAAFAILQNKKSWVPIVKESIEIAKQNDFTGILLDLELSAAPFDSVVADVSSFASILSREIKSEDLSFGITLYGDTFYRKRSYDVAYLSQIVDEVMIMGYDFHKARGETGPNFPLKGKQKYGYDLETLLGDLSGVPARKITYIFGMYGYDWLVDEKKRPIRPAKAISYADIKKSFIDKCAWKNCTVLRDSLSAETEVNYVDDNLGYHILWFEDPVSVEEKKKLLRQKGIGNTAYWVYGYF